MNLVRRTLLLAALPAALFLTGCSTDKQDQPASPAGGDADAVGHIHGLGVDQADGALYVATHFGLFRVDKAGEPKRVADRWQDTMAFTVAGPNHFLASGHPDLREELPPHLGLIESTDAGQTWQPLALQGEADFHILERVGDTLYAYEATSGRLLATTDERAFDEVAKLPLLGLTADPGAPDRLLGLTDRGRLVHIDAVTGDTEQLPGPTLLVLDTTSGGEVVGIDPEGTIQVSDDAGETWTPRGTIDGQPAAFTITDAAWYAATAEQVFRSEDDGVSWTQVL
jgi:hypothetical protein